MTKDANTAVSESEGRPSSGDVPLTANAEFKNPHSLGNRVGRLLWNIVYIVLYRWTPPRLGMPWRKILLKCFGAKLGRTWIHPSTRIWAPWRLQSGDDVFIDRGCNLYNPYGIRIGDRVIISLEAFLCTASHDHTKRNLPLVGNAIRIDSDCWIAAQSLVMPGIEISKGSVVGAGSVVTRNVAPVSIVAGNPARVIGPRHICGTE